MKENNTMIPENMEERKELAKRLQRLTYYYTEEYVKELDNKKQEETAIKEMENNPDGELRCICLTADNNMKVMMDCITDVIKAVNILKNPDEDVDSWMIAGINAAMDKANEMKIIPFDLPVCINGMLGAQYR